MSKELLIELQKECSELAAAGSDLAVGNFKLQKLFPKFQMIGEKVKPFRMVSERINTLLNSPKEESEENLISLATLVNAILLTQADTDVEGEIKEQGGVASLINTNTPNRIIAPIMEALTTTGGGRYNIIDNAIKEGIFEDSRLLPLLVQGLDDKYAEIGQLIYDYLASNNRPELLVTLQEGFDRNGKKGDALKLNLISKILGEDIKEFCINLLEDSSKDVKAEAVLILGNLKGTEQILLEQAKSKVKEVRRAAYFGLAKLTSEGAKEELIAAIKKSDYDIVLEAIGDNTELIGEECLLEGFKYVYDKIIKNGITNDIQRIINILNEMRYHKSEKMFKLLVKCLKEDSVNSLNVREFGRTIFVERLIAECVADYDNLPKDVVELLEDRKVRFDNRNFDIAFKASLKSRSQEEVYDMYSPYFINKSVNKDMIEEMLQTLAEYLGDKGIRHRKNTWYGRLSEEDIKSVIKTKPKKFDRRWITIFKMYKAYGLLSYTLEKEDKPTVEFLVNKMINYCVEDRDKRGRYKDFTSELMEIFMGLIKINYEEVYEVIMGKIKATTGYNYSFDNILLLIPYLPEKYIEEVRKYVVELRIKDVSIDNSYIEMRIKNIEEALGHRIENIM